jgi:hypothetical protein
MRRLERIAARIRAKHFAHPPASASRLKRLGRLKLPPDVHRFYELTDGAYLHATPQTGGFTAAPGSWWKWKVLPSRDLTPIAELSYMSMRDLYRESHSWITVVDVQDGDYLAINTLRGHAGEILDCFHETVGAAGQTSIVAESFTEMLDKMLAGSRPFWLSKQHRALGVY